MVAAIGGSSVTTGQSAGRQADPRLHRTGRVRAAARPERADPATKLPRSAHTRRPDLDDLPRGEAPLAGPARVAAAARAFSAGNGYLTGLLVDRTI